MSRVGLGFGLAAAMCVAGNLVPHLAAAIIAAVLLVLAVFAGTFQRAGPLVEEILRTEAGVPVGEECRQS